MWPSECAAHTHTHWCSRNIVPKTSGITGKHWRGGFSCVWIIHASTPPAAECVCLIYMLLPAGLRARRWSSLVSVCDWQRWFAAGLDPPELRKHKLTSRVLFKTGMLSNLHLTTHTVRQNLFLTNARFSFFEFASAVASRDSILGFTGQRSTPGDIAIC